MLKGSAFLLTLVLASALSLIAQSNGDFTSGSMERPLQRSSSLLVNHTQSVNGAVTIADPNLGPLQNNGGPTQTHIMPTVAAGVPPMSTGGAPGGPLIGPPTWGTGGTPGVTIGQVCRSPTRAAGGILSPWC